MSEQWFLDLDGVRSGPYQTSEVMSLVAEGEILPHHLIATELKSQKWTTILEWRLNQNKIVEPKKAPPFLHTESLRPIPPIIEEPVEEMGEEIVEEPTEKKIEISEPEKQEPILQTPTEATPPPAPTHLQSISPHRPKRDPMAEMFDMLQNTKQKREVKSQQSHAQIQTRPHTYNSHPPTPPENLASSIEKSSTSNNGNWLKTVLVGSFITILGFALGQYFQQKKESESVVSTPAKVATVLTPATPVPPTPSEPTNSPIETSDSTRTVDRSTDKITIRAHVTPTPEPAKDLQDLKDLKKELQELKALKEEMHNSGAGRPGSTPNINNNEEPENITPEEPFEENGNPDGPSGKDVHY